VGKGGVVRDPEVHREVLTSFARWIAEAGLSLVGLVASPIRGPAGNVEFLARVRLAPGEHGDATAAIDRVLAEVGEVP
jgi:23S rRNA (cytidine1920-2'-O)/16S rRNA (cytidine1409-2'-O)-methyltransferase